MSIGLFRKRALIPSKKSLNSVAHYKRQGSFITKSYALFRKDPIVNRVLSKRSVVFIGHTLSKRSLQLSKKSLILISIGHFSRAPAKLTKLGWESIYWGQKPEVSLPQPPTSLGLLPSRACFLFCQQRIFFPLFKHIYVHTHLRTVCIDHKTPSVNIASFCPSLNKAMFPTHN